MTSAALAENANFFHNRLMDSDDTSLTVEDGQLSFDWNNSLPPLWRKSDLTITGGEIYIDGPSDNGNSAIDYGDRSSAYVNGGTLVAIGSSGMAEGMSDSSKQKVLMVKLGEQMEAGNVVLTDSEGNVIVSYTALKTYDCVIISTAEVESGATYTLTTSGTTTEVTAE